MRLVLSTRNAHKVREFAGLLDGVDVAPLPDEVELPPETGDTFAENALVKARTAAVCAARSPSMPCWASASRSSRWARLSGVRSAVAWTSTRPPSPVMTTFASTSAVESSE